MSSSHLLFQFFVCFGISLRPQRQCRVSCWHLLRLFFLMVSGFSFCWRSCNHACFCGWARLVAFLGALSLGNVVGTPPPVVDPQHTCRKPARAMFFILLFFLLLHFSCYFRLASPLASRWGPSTNAKDIVDNFSGFSSSWRSRVCVDMWPLCGTFSCLFTSAASFGWPLF